jgi:hypothetical protein
MTANTTALKVLPNTIHCVKTGIAIVSFADSNALAQLNAAIKDGMIECGTAVGRILIADGKRPEGSKNYRWKQRSRQGQWRVFTGGKIGEHNEAVLVENGFTADPATRSKGTVGNRQYGVYNEPKVVKQPSTMTTFLGGNVVTESQPIAKAPAKADTQCPQPSPLEMQGTGSYGKWVSKCKGLGFNRQEANIAWKAAKAALQSEPTVKATPSKPAIVMPPPPKAQPTANAKQGTVLHVPAAALQNVLANIGEAKVDYNPATEMFTVSM